MYECMYIVTVTNTFMYCYYVSKASHRYSSISKFRKHCMATFNLKLNLLIRDLFYISLYKSDFKSSYMYYEIGKLTNEK